MIAALVDKGHLNYNDLVCKHWPEFGQNGKESITVSDLVSHRAGLCFFDDGPIQLDSIPEANCASNPEKVFQHCSF